MRSLLTFLKIKKPLKQFRGFWYDLVAYPDEISNNLLSDFDKFLGFFEDKKTSKLL